MRWHLWKLPSSFWVETALTYLRIVYTKTVDNFLLLLVAIAAIVVMA